MSSSDRRAFLTALAALAALPLAACGFAPVHGGATRDNSLRGKVLADAPENARDFALVARFEDRIGRASTPLWALGYQVDTRQLALGISPDNVSTRFNITGKLTWSLRPVGGPVGGDEPVLTGVIENFTSYSATGSTLAVRAARHDAEARLMVILADQLVSQLFAQSGKLLAENVVAGNQVE